jgi:release factor glutamine methyltransferase
MRTKINLRTWQEYAVQQLNSSETPLMEAQILLASVLDQSRVWVIAHAEQELSPDQIEKLDSCLVRLKNGEPLPYITGNRAFFGLDFHVTPDVLIPRPETELLVEEAIQWLTNNPTKRSAADVGTGSGAIAISLADTIPDLCITAIDVSPQALEIAKTNCARFHHEDQITFYQNDLLEGISSKFDLITANLPYIPKNTLDSLPLLRFEPRLALNGGEDGLLFIDRLLEQSMNNLNPGGMILLEIEATISELVLQQARSYFHEARIDLQFDYANLPRIVKIQK